MNPLPTAAICNNVTLEGFHDLPPAFNQRPLAWRPYNIHWHAEPKEKEFLKVLGFHLFQIPSAGLTDSFLSISLCKKAQ